jgi:uncharacterized Zn-binding protein involved in type VI secretion
MPAAVRIGDISSGHDGFNPRPDVKGSSTVYINGIAAHRLSDYWPPHTNGRSVHDGVLSKGSPSVYVNGLALGRIGDSVSCGDTAARGSPTVNVN